MNTIDSVRLRATVGKIWCIMLLCAFFGCGAQNTTSTTSNTNTPRIVDMYPQDLAVNVPVTASICFNFNVMMDSTTINSDTVWVLDEFGNHVPGVPIYPLLNEAACFMPSTNLIDSMRYTVIVRYGIKDFYGNPLDSYTWSFITTDNMKVPSVALTIPSNGSVGVSNQSLIIASFSEFMNLSSVNNSTFKLLDGNGDSIAGTIAFDGMMAILTPSILLASGSTYSAVITTGVQDLYGNSPVSDYSWSFTTTGVPFVQLIYPASGETAVSTDSTIIVWSSVTLDYASINTANFLVNDSHGNLVPITVIPDQYMTKVYLLPEAALAYEESYTVTVTSQVKDTQGRLVGKDYSWSFTTGPAGTGSWVPLSPINAPTDHFNACVVWTGTEMIIWGGYDGTNYLNTGARYSPATDTWQPISMNGVPPAMIAQAVWTGTEMIVWSGGTGGRYNPATDTWQPISATSAPALVNDSTSVWTGTDMILWGGYSKGAGYALLTDQWTPTSTIGAPAGRVDHTAVWTGTEMIVWGGCGDGYAPDIGQTGGRYNPATDTWLPTTTQGAPAGRNAHLAVWTGTEMIVWGGNSFSLGMNTNTGGRYDPSTNSWQATAIYGAPSSRRDPLAVWTGTGMIVWGGMNMAGYLNTGGLYNPSTNTWQPTTTINAPVGAYTQSSIWTGTEMIVWGSTLNARGRYKP